MENQTAVVFGWWLVLATHGAGLGVSTTLAAVPQPGAAALGAPPNILVVVLDDIGMDQMSFPPFGWDAAPEAASLPVLAEIAANGVSFTNFWATPECSPSRAAILTGRWGHRTGVVTAIVDPMLPWNQLHPSEITVPELLREAGYASGMLGKYHMGGGPENTPAGYGYQAPFASAGLDYYDGYWDLPDGVDTTLGGQAPEGSFDCGGIAGVDAVGAACFPDGTCIENVHPLDAMAMGGMPLLNASGQLAATCAEGDCSAIDFTLTNAYYVWQRITCDHGAATQGELPWREYITDFVGRRTAEWIDQARASGTPWLAFSTHSAAHTPIQPPPPSLTGPADSDVSCVDLFAQRQQYRLMCEGLDRSIGNMLVSLNLGSWVRGEFVLGDLAAANTVIIVMNDNGTLGYNVLPPFDPARAKQTVYETGVRSGLIVAGTPVAQPGRAVSDMVSSVDLFGLMCELGGVDWRAVESPERPIDCEPMLPYLTNPRQGPIREFDFTLYRQGTFVYGQVGPCIMGASVVDGLMSSQSLCEENGGCWAGGASAPPYRDTNYCDLMSTDPLNCSYYCEESDTTFCTLPPSMAGGCPDGSTPLNPPSLAQYAVRHGLWKLVVVQQPECLAPDDCSMRLFRLTEPVPPLVPGIEAEDGAPGVWNPLADDMPTAAQSEFGLLRAFMVETLLSAPQFPPDGNLDGVVDGEDLAGLLSEWGGMGFWDANQDGVVNGADLAMVLSSWGPAPLPLSVVPRCLLADTLPLLHEYTFTDGLTDSVPRGADAQSLGGTVQRGEYLFAANQGLRIPVGGAALNSFAVEFEVTVESLEFPFVKLVDLFDRTLDRGFYRVPDGGVFQILPPANTPGPGTIDLGVPTVVRLERDASLRTISAYINGQLQWVQEDPLGLGVPPADGAITLFADDVVTNEAEAFSGRVNWVRVYGGG